jgi:hypothetical protein
MADHAVCHRDIDQLLTEVSRLQRAVKDIQNVICEIDGPTWEQAQEERHTLWIALDKIDHLTIQALAYRVERAAQFDGHGSGSDG